MPSAKPVKPATEPDLTSPGPPEIDTDPAASDGYRPGDVVDFERLYRASFSRIRATLVALLRDPAEAEDCAQDAFVRAFHAWPRWRPEAPAEAWVHRIAINVAVSHRRRRRVTGLLHELLRTPERDAAAAAAERHDLLDALRALPPRQAAAIVLRHLYGYSNREIATALDIPERTVASRLAAARARLARDLHQHLQEKEMGTP